MSTNGVPTSEVDVLVIGAGFSGCYLLHLLRKRGYQTKVLEAGSTLGGTWHWNEYPGARVDIEHPWYGYSDPAIWGSWVWKERYPGHAELRRYFEHVDKIWDLSKDISLKTRVVEAQWKTDRWVVETAEGDSFKCKWLLLGIGTSSKPYTPDWKGRDLFKGEMHHTAFWPKDLDMTGKRVAIIGSGASGLQVMQEAGKVASKITHYVRTPNIALPMQQRKISEEEIYQQRAVFTPLFNYSRTTNGGLPISDTGKATFDDSPEAREVVWEEQWRRGGFHWGFGCYNDILFNKEANRVMYDFWARKTRARISDPKKRELLAPLEPPHWLGTKRMSLEQDYYEQCDKPNVEITNSPVVEIKETGILFEDGFQEFDIIVEATGFDAVTGGLRTIGIKDKDGVDLDDRWRDGVSTLVGMTVPGFPNMAFTYGPQAPTAFTCGPTFIEMQSEWIVDVISKQAEEGITAVEPKESETAAWRKQCHDIANMTLATQTDSWYMGTNIPGKNREFLLFLGGIPSWHAACKDALDGWKGFEVTKG